MKCGLFLASLCLLAFLPEAKAKQESVTLGASLFPPSAYIDPKSGKCVGENIDVATEILSHYDIKLNVVCTLPARMYRLVKNAEVDFTVNVKTTKVLKPYVEFIEPPLKELVINVYQYNDSNVKTISAVRNFDYNGVRKRLVDEHYRFVDLPTSEAALQMFLKRRVEALISYQSNVKHFSEQNALIFPADVIVTPQLKVNAHFGIASGSEHFELLKAVFSDYAEKRQLTYFVPLTSD